MRFCRGTAGLKPPDGRARLCGITTRHSSHACACQCHVSSRHSVSARRVRRGNAESRVGVSGLPEAPDMVRCMWQESVTLPREIWRYTLPEPDRDTYAAPHTGHAGPHSRSRLRGERSRSERRTHSHGAWALGRCASGTTLHTLMSKHTHTHPSAVMTSVTSCIAHSSLRPPHATARRQQQAAAPSARRLATATRRSIAGSSMPWLPRHRACSLRVVRALGAPFAPAWQCACRGRRSSRG